MRLCLGYNTAFDYWRWHDLANRPAPVRRQPNFYAPTRELITEARKELDIHKLPLHAIVSNANDKRNHHEVKCHIAQIPLPENSFVKHSKHVAVASPEACFLQLANMLSFTELLQAGYELCRTYAIDPLSSDLLQRHQRTTIRSIESYLEKAAGINGSTKACKALQYICDNSASPMETKMALLLCLPTWAGGYGFPKPTLNKTVTVLDSDRLPKTYRCDLIWPNQKIALEYDSHLHHTTNKKVYLDSTRRVSIESSNTHVLSITKQQVYNASAFNDLADVVAKYLGIRFKTERKDFGIRQRKLRRNLGLGT